MSSVCKQYCLLVQVVIAILRNFQIPDALTVMAFLPTTNRQSPLEKSATVLGMLPDNYLDIGRTSLMQQHHGIPPDAATFSMGQPTHVS